MSTLTTSQRGRDGRLWAIAFGLSLLLNLAILGVTGFAAIRSQVSRKFRPAAPSPAESVMTIFPELPAPDASAVTADSVPETARPQFARTSDDQIAPPQDRADFIGERNTRATSDRAPDPTAPPLPSQAGEKPKSEDDLETTESDYQDGKLTAAPAQSSPADPPVAAATTMPADPAVASPLPPGHKVPDPGNDETSSSPPPREKLLDSANPVDVPVPREVAESKEMKPTPPEREKNGGAQAKAADLPKPPTPQPIKDPAFAGNQRKAAIVGSISRNGRSALNVADTPLGRYQAIISRAVELEWQRNCVRHRDFITPGYLTVRFFVEPGGKVRTVQFVGQMETGEVQKGFTLNSIRDAEIPPMPASIKQEYSKQPLELIFNFLF